jgi:acylphosphatase
VTRTSVDVRITGLVQRVFFRAGCAERAGRLGVAGWVANEPDGSVSGQNAPTKSPRGRFEGAPEAVDALLAWCREGTPRARVRDVAVTAAEPTGATGFTAR